MRNCFKGMTYVKFLLASAFSVQLEAGGRLKYTKERNVESERILLCERLYRALLKGLLIRKEFIEKIKHRAA